jgi:hypothetical protein
VKEKRETEGEGGKGGDQTTALACNTKTLSTSNIFIMKYRSLNGLFIENIASALQNLKNNRTPADVATEKLDLAKELAEEGKLGDKVKELFRG